VSVFLLACSPPVLETAIETETALETGSDSEGDSDTDGDTGVDTGQACAEDAVAVGSVCLDRYEATVFGQLGGPDAFLGDQPGNPTAQSLQGVDPLTAITFSQAWVACEAAGKRLPTGLEFEDGVDGVLGAGGSAYPYGEVFDETACATTNADNSQQYTSVQPTGSLSRCVSTWGAFDLIGNVWEWTVAEGRMDPTAWLANGVLTEQEGLLHGPGDQVVPMAASIDPPEFQTDDEGRLYATPEQLGQRPAFGSRGYLRTTSQPTRAEDLLPFELVQEDDVSPAYVRVLWEADGLPVADKRGCGWYTGDAVNCTASKAGLGGHFHDFEGTVGFRCVAD
jgi:hypothetical protein